MMDGFLLTGQRSPAEGYVCRELMQDKNNKCRRGIPMSEKEEEGVTDKDGGMEGYQMDPRGCHGARIGYSLLPLWVWLQPDRRITLHRLARYRSGS